MLKCISQCSQRYTDVLNLRKCEDLHEAIRWKTASTLRMNKNVGFSWVLKQAVHQIIKKKKSIFSFNHKSTTEVVIEITSSGGWKQVLSEALIRDLRRQRGKIRVEVIKSYLFSDEACWTLMTWRTSLSSPTKDTRVEFVISFSYTW